MDGPVVSLRALKPIKKGEEIFIAYIDTTNPYARRRSELKAQWFFDCNCIKCQKGPTLLEDRWLMDPDEFATNEWWRSTADSLMEEDFATDPANYVGESQNEKRVAAIQGKAFETYSKAQDLSNPAKQKAILTGLDVCKKSGLWPIYRQPCAGLRDDLIVNLLSTGDFESAYKQCAIRYRYILPNLYPQENHPVRVIQVWQTAMLALHLYDLKASEAEPGHERAQIDLCMVGATLLNEVLKSFKLNDGEHNSFAESVKKKLDEMRTEFYKKWGGSAEDFKADMLRGMEAFRQLGDCIEGERSKH